MLTARDRLTMRRMTTNLTFGHFSSSFLHTQLPLYIEISVGTVLRFSVFSVFRVLEHFVRVSGRVSVLVLLSRCTRMRVRTIAEWDLRGLIKAYFGAVRGFERGNEKVSGMHYLINWLT